MKGVRKGDYTRSLHNKEYAVRAVELLKKEPGLAAEPLALWRRAVQGKTIVHNQQMDVVTALLNAGLVERRQ